MNAFLVNLENIPGALATVAEALGARGVNIISVSGSVCGDGGHVAILTNDAVGTRSALAAVGVTYDEREVVEVGLAHVPGSLGRAARRMAEEGINIEAIMPTGMTGNEVTLGFATDNPSLAREVLATSSLSIR